VADAASTASTEDPAVADELIDALRTWVAREVVPVASEYEHADEYPEPLVEQMKAFGIFGTTIPEEYGGLGLGSVTYARVIEELSYGWMSLAGILNTHSIVSNLLKRSGTDEQRQRWLPAMVGGDPRAAFSLSEPDAGSDTKALRCKAVRDGDEYVITGTKMWVTNGERAGLVALAARTDEGITCFLVEKEPGPTFGGISVSKRIEKLGYKGLETVEMTYDGHRVPAANVLVGEAGLWRGLSQVLSSLELGRVNVAARAVGVARAAFDAAMRYAHERETFGKPIVEHQAIGFKLAEMGTKLHAARLMTLDAAARFDRGERCDVEAGMAKFFASETALELATEAMRIHGGYGFTTEFPVERFYRDAPLMIIGEGTNEIQRMVIARGLQARWNAGR
jgi:alkylation response protein AidB-like acyl-CoA dehydrogenase